ncbi:Hypothetical protein SCLAV_2540 [Streptomyces clavuligerus]|uniref:Uncharacterized protein n=1 Tax=Streptomyces clavuligerus TaxID=1901 RepID=E2Q9N5_STRCL|nr:Hypothetical protein SCLAV_2540 [Streptomyces clavuligerus]
MPGRPLCARSAPLCRRFRKPVARRAPRAAPGHTSDPSADAPEAVFPSRRSTFPTSL